MPKYDQHFLRNPRVTDRIVEACRIGPQDLLIEIGSGKGVLTAALLGAGPRHLWAIEVDPAMCGYLKKRFGEIASLTVVPADFLNLDLDRGEWNGGRPKVVGNLPYSVATPILQRVLSWPRFESAVFMLQKEVGERILAEPGGKSYGILTLSARLKAKAEPVCLVPRRDFSPPPDVDSIVVRLERTAMSPLPEKIAEADFFKVLKAAFGQRRKTLLNALSRGLDIPKAALRPFLKELGIEEGRRAETVSLEDYASLTAGIVELLHQGGRDRGPSDKI